MGVFALLVRSPVCNTEHVALCVSVKIREPRIEWHFAKRSADSLAEYVDKVRIVSDDIAAMKF